MPIPTLTLGLLQAEAGLHPGLVLVGREVPYGAGSLMAWSCIRLLVLISQHSCGHCAAGLAFWYLLLRAPGQRGESLR